MIDKDRGALRLAAVDASALALGLTPGMTLADARARLPDVDAVPLDAAGDQILLERLLADFDRFSPMVALDPPWGLVLDVTGCAHLFGGESRLSEAVRHRAESVGLSVRFALARTPEAARALARFGSGGIVPEGQDSRWTGPLPVAALELGDSDLQALRRAGLATVADVDTRPRAALAARFGSTLPDRLDRLMGRVDVRISPQRSPPPIRSDRVLLEPITGMEQVETVLSDLLTDLQGQLESRSLGARQLILSLFRVDGDVRQITLELARPARKAGLLLKLWHERLGSLSHPLEAGFGYDHLRLGARGLASLLPEQAQLEAAPDISIRTSELLDRLSARLGSGAVLRFRAVDTHLPERASRLCRYGDPVQQDNPWAGLSDIRQAACRPLHLFDPPQPIEAIALAPDSPPARFRWRRVDHRVTHAEGPERIETEWWRAPGHRVRDYYRVEDSEGRRFWLFRAGSYGADPPPRWYLHGLFA